MSIKPKIAFVSTMYSGAWGGSEDLWYESAMHLRSRGFNIAANVCKWYKPVPKFDELEKNGAQVTRRPQDHEPDRKIFQRTLHRVLRQEPFQWLKQVQPDLVVISLSGHHQGGEWMDACQVFGVPYVIVVQAVGDGIWPSSHTADCMRRYYGSAVKCCFVSMGNLEQVKNQIASPMTNAEVVRNPFKVSFEASPQWPGDETTNLACVGRLHPVSKGQDVLFSVLSHRKWKERPLTVRLYGGGPDEASLKNLQRMYELENVTFAGFQNDVQQIWRECHALVLPSRFEGLPLAIVEAMLCGRPCIVTDVAGNAELLEDNVSGFVAAAPRVKYLDEALERAWSRRSEWQSMGAKAASQVRRLVPPDPVATFSDLVVEALPKK